MEVPFYPFTVLRLAEASNSTRERERQTWGKVLSVCHVSPVKPRVPCARIRKLESQGVQD